VIRAALELEGEYGGDVARVTDTALLVARARAGDREAFGALYAAFHRMVHAVALTIARTNDAEDIVQDVFLVAWRELPTVSEPARFGGWLQTIARRRAVDHLRRKRPEGADADDVGRDPTPTSEAEEALLAVRALPETYRETMMMRLVEGLTGPEIATLTGMTPESVRVNLCRGMKLLRERLGEAT
jgi:RNA polymerase sigma-70 factor (ECF subfamily)